MSSLQYGTAVLGLLVSDLRSRVSEDGCDGPDLSNVWSALHNVWLNAPGSFRGTNSTGLLSVSSRIRHAPGAASSTTKSISDLTDVLQRMWIDGTDRWYALESMRAAAEWLQVQEDVDSEISSRLCGRAEAIAEALLQAAHGDDHDRRHSDNSSGNTDGQAVPALVQTLYQLLPLLVAETVGPRSHTVTGVVRLRRVLCRLLDAALVAVDVVDAGSNSTAVIEIDDNGRMSTSAVQRRRVALQAEALAVALLRYADADDTDTDAGGSGVLWSDASVRAMLESCVSECHAPSMALLRMYLDEHYDFRSSENVGPDVWFDYFDACVHCLPLLAEAILATVPDDILVPVLLNERVRTLLHTRLPPLALRSVLSQTLGSDHRRFVNLVAYGVDDVDVTAASGEAQDLIDIAALAIDAAVRMVWAGAETDAPDLLADLRHFVRRCLRRHHYAATLTAKDPRELLPVEVLVLGSLETGAVNPYLEAAVEGADDAAMGRTATQLLALAHPVVVERVVRTLDVRSARALLQISEDSTGEDDEDDDMWFSDRSLTSMQCLEIASMCTVLSSSCTPISGLASRAAASLLPHAIDRVWHSSAPDLHALAAVHRSLKSLQSFQSPELLSSAQSPLPGKGRTFALVWEALTLPSMAVQRAAIAILMQTCGLDLWSGLPVHLSCADGRESERLMAPIRGLLVGSVRTLYTENDDTADDADDRDIAVLSLLDETVRTLPEMSEPVFCPGLAALGLGFRRSDDTRDWEVSASPEAVERSVAGVLLASWLFCAETWQLVCADPHTSEVVERVLAWLGALLQSKCRGCDRATLEALLKYRPEWSNAWWRRMAIETPADSPLKPAVFRLLAQMYTTASVHPDVHLAIMTPETEREVLDHILSLCLSHSADDRSTAPDLWLPLTALTQSLIYSPTHCILRTPCIDREIINPPVDTSYCAPIDDDDDDSCESDVQSPIPYTESEIVHPVVAALYLQLLNLAPKSPRRIIGLSVMILQCLREHSYHFAVAEIAEVVVRALGALWHTRGEEASLLAPAYTHWLQLGIYIAETYDRSDRSAITAAVTGVSAPFEAKAVLRQLCEEWMCSLVSPTIVGGEKAETKVSAVRSEKERETVTDRERELADAAVIALRPLCVLNLLQHFPSISVPLYDTCDLLHAYTGNASQALRVQYFLSGGRSVCPVDGNGRTDDSDLWRSEQLPELSDLYASLTSLPTSDPESLHAMNHKLITSCESPGERTVEEANFDARVGALLTVTADLVRSTVYGTDMDSDGSEAESEAEREREGERERERERDSPFANEQSELQWTVVWGVWGVILKGWPRKAVVRAWQEENGSGPEVRDGLWDLLEEWRSRYVEREGERERAQGDVPQRNQDTGKRLFVEALQSLCTVLRSLLLHRLFTISLTDLTPCIKSIIGALEYELYVYEGWTKTAGCHSDADSESTTDTDNSSGSESLGDDEDDGDGDDDDLQWSTCKSLLSASASLLFIAMKSLTHPKLCDRAMSEVASDRSEWDLLLPSVDGLARALMNKAPATCGENYAEIVSGITNRIRQALRCSSDMDANEMLD